MLGSNYPPDIHADRVISLGTFSDIDGRNVGGLQHWEIDLLLGHIKEHEAVALRSSDIGNVLVNDKNYLVGMAFVNAGFWKVYGFNFLAGGAVTEDDYRDRKHYAIINKKLSNKLFHTTYSVGQKLEYYGVEVEIKGVVDDVSPLATPTGYSEMWMPGFVNNRISAVDILFPTRMDMSRAKEMVSHAVQQTFAQRNVQVQVSADKLFTTRESKLQKVGGERGVGGSVGVLLFILLLIPAVNIVTLAMSNTRGKLKEIAVRRAFGASRFSAFLDIMAGNLVLVLIGVFLGVALVKPTYYLIQHTVLQNPFLEGVSLIPNIDAIVIVLFILPLMLLFLLMFGGIPAYRAARQNIATILKGGMS
jgi:ABC-type antimicrobial peptide transport system permease subunit